MAKEHEMNLELKLGEQLTGLSPTVCRRAIFAIRDEDDRLGGECREVNLPKYCEGLIYLLFEQTDVQDANGGISLLRRANRKDLYDILNQMVIFLDVVEGVTQNPTGDHIPPGTFDGEEESRRG
jgi:hypothetical protein